MSTATASKRQKPNSNSSSGKSFSCSLTDHTDDFSRLPQCSYDHRCRDYTHKHRTSFVHSAFLDDHEARYRFLIESAKWAITKQPELREEQKTYLWDQFSCDFNAYPGKELELHRNFLMQCFEEAIRRLDSLTNVELCILQLAFTRLEEQSITGIHWLNKAFMMWALGQINEQRTNKIIMMAEPTTMDFTIEKLSRDLTSGRLRGATGLGRRYDTASLQDQFIAFMADRIPGVHRDVATIRTKEMAIINFQDAMKKANPSKLMGLDERTISNTGFVFLIQMEMGRRSEEDQAELRKILGELNTHYF